MARFAHEAVQALPLTGADWTNARPTRRQRVIIAIAAAAFGAGWWLLNQHVNGPHRTDFGVVWFGARALLQGANPYELIGPGRVFEWYTPLFYPATALVALAPFGLLPEQVASLTFVSASSFLLAYGVTRQSCHLLALFASQAFADCARAGQWSILFTAALFLPWLSFLAVAKPQSGIPLLAASSRKGLNAAVVGGLLLLAISLIMLPSWPLDWVASVGGGGHRPVITARGGVLVLLLLSRWRRPESWLIIAMACVPQALAQYSVLMLLTVAATFREASALVLISIAGAFADPYMMPAEHTTGELHALLAQVEIATAYLPATLVVLRRPNQGPSPAWLEIMSTHIERLQPRWHRS